jgi:Family of unknown function (DUF6174)
MVDRGKAYLRCTIVVGGVIVLLVCGLLLLRLAPLDTLELSAARSRWATRPFSHYRLDLKYGVLEYCKQSIEIKDEQIVAVFQNTCAEPVPTVNDLFDRIERDITVLSGHCGPNGCACDGTIVVSATYDPQFGYPHSKRVDLDSAARWRFPDYWQRRLAGKLCTSWDMGREDITVVALTPMT